MRGIWEDRGANERAMAERLAGLLRDAGLGPAARVRTFAEAGRAPWSAGVLFETADGRTFRLTVEDDTRD